VSDEGKQVTEQQAGEARLPECPEHGLRPEVQTRDFCDVRDDYGHCGRFLVYPEKQESE
jgi:hypothetical protein